MGGVFHPWLSGHDYNLYNLGLWAKTNPFPSNGMHQSVHTTEKKPRHWFDEFFVCLAGFYWVAQTGLEFMILINSAFPVLVGIAMPGCYRCLVYLSSCWFLCLSPLFLIPFELVGFFFIPHTCLKMLKIFNCYFSWSHTATPALPVLHKVTPPSSHTALVPAISLSSPLSLSLCFFQSLSVCW